MNITLLVCLIFAVSSQTISGDSGSVHMHRRVKELMDGLQSLTERFEDLELKFIEEQILTKRLQIKIRKLEKAAKTATVKPKHHDLENYVVRYVDNATSKVASSINSIKKGLMYQKTRTSDAVKFCKGNLNKLSSQLNHFSGSTAVLSERLQAINLTLVNVQRRKHVAEKFANLGDKFDDVLSNTTQFQKEVKESLAAFNNSLRVKCIKCKTDSSKEDPEASTVKTTQVTDIDECSNLGICGTPAAGECVNTPGSYACRCHNGYKLSNGKCTDIDECLTSDRCGPLPSGQCVNTPGSYSCICSTGYGRDSNGQCTVPAKECVVDRPGDRVRSVYRDHNMTKLSSVKPGHTVPDGTVILSQCVNWQYHKFTGDSRRECVQGQWSGIKPSCTRIPKWGTDTDAQRDVNTYQWRGATITEEGHLIVKQGVRLKLWCFTPAPVMFSSVKGLEPSMTATEGDTGYYKYTYLVITDTHPRHSDTYFCKNKNTGVQLAKYIVRVI